MTLNLNQIVYFINYLEKAMSKWENTVSFDKVPHYNVEMEIDTDYAILHLRGDQHIGQKGIDVNKLIQESLNVIEEHKNHMFIIDTGDMIENNVKNSKSDINTNLFMFLNGLDTINDDFKLLKLRNNCINFQ